MVLTLNQFRVYTQFMVQIYLDLILQQARAKLGPNKLDPIMGPHLLDQIVGPAIN